MQYRILFADRSPVIQTLLEDILEREGFEVKVAGNSETVLEELNSFNPHIVIADISLRGLDGYCLCKEIKEMAAFQSIPVILLAGAYDPFDEEYAKLVKADDYILKPFDSLELVGKVRKLLKFEYSATYDPPAYSDDAFNLPHPERHVIQDSANEGESLIAQESAKNIDNASLGLEGGKESLSIPSNEAELGLSDEIETSRQIDRSELKDLVVESFDALIAEQFKTAITAELSSSLRKQIRIALNEIAPEVIEEILKEKINIVISSLMTEIQAEIKNALPGIVETILRRKFEKVN